MAALLDSGNRANESPLNNGGAWKGPVFSGDGQVKLELERFVNAENKWCNSYWATKFAANQLVRITVAATTGSRFFELTARIQNPGGGTLNCYYLAISSAGAWELGSVKAGAEATIGTGTKTFVVGDKFYLECNGTTIKCIHETSAGVKTTVIEKTNSTVTGEGFIGAAMNGTGVAFDDFYGGAIGGEEVLIVAPVASATASAAPPTPLVAPGVFIAQAAAGGAISTPIVKPVAIAGGAIAVAPAAAPEVRPTAPSGAAIAAAGAASPAITPAPPAGVAEANGASPVPGICAVTPVGAAVAAASAPTPALRVVAAAANAVAGGLVPTPVMRIASTAASAVAGALAPSIETAAVIIPPYWQGRARLLLGYARALLRGGAHSAAFGATSKPAAAFEPTSAPSAAFSNPAPEAKFAQPDAAAIIEDPDPAAKIVT